MSRHFKGKFLTIATLLLAAPTGAWGAQSPGRPPAGYIGVGLREVPPDLPLSAELRPGNGALIGAVAPESPAEAAGLRPGDIVVSAAGWDITAQVTLTQVIASQAPGSQIGVSILRDDRRQTLVLTIAARPRETSAAPSSTPAVTVAQAASDWRFLGFADVGSVGVVYLDRASITTEASASARSGNLRTIYLDPRARYSRIDTQLTWRCDDFFAEGIRSTGHVRQGTTESTAIVGDRAFLGARSDAKAIACDDRVRAPILQPSITQSLAEDAATRLSVRTVVTRGLSAGEWSRFAYLSRFGSVSNWYVDRGSIGRDSTRSRSATLLVRTIGRAAQDNVVRVAIDCSTRVLARRFSAQVLRGALLAEHFHDGAFNSAGLSQEDLARLFPPLCQNDWSALSPVTPVDLARP